MNRGTRWSSSVVCAVEIGGVGPGCGLVWRCTLFPFHLHDRISCVCVASGSESVPLLRTVGRYICLFVHATHASHSAVSTLQCYRPVLTPFWPEPQTFFARALPLSLPTHCRRRSIHLAHHRRPLCRDRDDLNQTCPPTAPPGPPTILISSFKTSPPSLLPPRHFFNFLVTGLGDRPSARALASHSLLLVAVAIARCRSFALDARSRMKRPSFRHKNHPSVLQAPCATTPRVA